MVSKLIAKLFEHFVVLNGELTSIKLCKLKSLSFVRYLTAIVIVIPAAMQITQFLAILRNSSFILEDGNAGATMKVVI